MVETVVAALVTDPTGIKLGLPTTARIMWVIYGDNVYKPSSHGGATTMEPGQHFKTLTLVDDQTLKLGGNFSC